MKLCLAVLVGSMFSCALAQDMLELSFKGASELTPEELKLADRAASIMTGGDFALIRSVEFFEDYAEGGRRQAAALNVGEGAYVAYGGAWTAPPCRHSLLRRRRGLAAKSCMTWSAACKT